MNLAQAWAKKLRRDSPLQPAEAINLLKLRLDLRTVRHTELIEIRAMSDTPDEAANLANTVAESFLAFRRDQNRRLRIEQEKEHPSPPGLIRDPMVQIVDRAVPPCKTHPA